MADKDIGFKIVAHQAGRHLLRLRNIDCQEWEPIGDTLQATERLADRAFRARSGNDRYVAYLEAYTRWEASAPWSLLAKSGLLSERERLPTRSFLFTLTPRGYHGQGGQFRLEVSGAPTQHIWFAEIRLWEEVPQRWWEESPALMALYPLCRHGKSRREAITYPARVIAAGEPDGIRRADLLTTLGIFGKLVYQGFDAHSLIGRENMRESPFYQEIMQEGAVEELRINVKGALEKRFGAGSSAEFQPPLAALTDLQDLRRLLSLAYQCKDLKDFRKGLRPTRRRS